MKAPRFPDDIRARAWLTMSVLHRDYGRFSLHTVARIVSRQHSSAITCWVRWLVEEQVLGRNTEDDACYVIRVEGDCPPAGRPLSRGFGAHQRNLWRAMRVIRSFTVEELALTASTDDCVVKPDQVRAYILGLEAADILIRTTTHPAHSWRLKASANTGPRAPVLMGAGYAFDLNTGRTFRASPDDSQRRAA